MPGILLPAKAGGAVALENVDVTNMYVGTIVVDDAAAAWQLTVSAAALDATHKAVLGVTGLRWVSYSASGGAAATYLAGRWETLQALFLASKVPQLTGFEYIKIGSNPNPPATSTYLANDANIEGGALSAGAGIVRIISSTVIQTPKTGKWGVVFRAAPKLPVNTHGSTYGLINAAATNLISFASIFSVNATNYYMSAGTTGATSIAVDGLFHTFALTSDGTTVTLWIDGVSAATKPTSGLVTDEPMALYFSSLLAGDAQASKVLYGFVEP
jgi:hypothetical protein